MLSSESGVLLDAVEESLGIVMYDQVWAAFKALADVVNNRNRLEEERERELVGSSKNTPKVTRSYIFRVILARHVLYECTEGLYRGTLGDFRHEAVLTYWAGKILDIVLHNPSEQREFVKLANQYLQSDSFTDSRGKEVKGRRKTEKPDRYESQMTVRMPAVIKMLLMSMAPRDVGHKTDPKMKSEVSCSLSKDQLKLVQQYRSTQTIIDAAVRGFLKVLFGETIAHVCVPGEEAKDEFVFLGGDF